MACKMCDRNGVIEKSEFLSKDIVSMWLKCDGLDFDAGQFMMLETPGFSLRRPFVIVDKMNGSARVIFKLRGEGTHLLAMLAAGTPLKVLAPLGEKFPEPEKDTTPLLVGGGIGIVTMLPLAKRLTPAHKPVMFMGAESRDSIIIESEFKGFAQVMTCTDDGTCGDKCNVVQLVEKYVFNTKGKYTIYACGPVPMLKSLGKFAGSKHIKCYVSLEERMACGVGACLCCAVKTKHGIKRVCKDGPVFEANDIKWNFIEEEISLG
jgi:dihydroorotate dehydrogenase electron transfer subunit